MRGRRILPVADFEDGEGAERAKKCEGSLLADEGKERISSLKPLEGIQPCFDLDDSTVRAIEP